MSYGIGGLAAGFTQGLDDHRQIKRQQGLDEMDRERHDLAMQTGQSNLQAAEQQYGIRGAEHEAWQQDRGRLQDEQQFNDEWTRAYQRYEMAGDPSGLAQAASQRLFDGAPAQIQPGEREYQITVGDQQFAVPREEFDAWARSMVDPGARTQYRQQIQDAIAQQQQGELEHQRKMEIERTKGGYGIERSMIGRMAPGSVGIGEDGGFMFQPDVGGPGGVQPTARGRDVQALARAQGISEGEAWDRLLNASGTPPEVGIPNIAKMLMSASYDMQDDPDLAFQRAEEMYHRYRGMGMQGGQYGIGQPGAGGGGQPGQVMIDGQQIPMDQVLQQATELAQSGELSVAEIAGEMVELGVPEEVAQQWQRQNAGIGR